jgi:UDP-N-acetylmuramate: L-alanyl-gamma-D-glutamyl-meso-diaminopimelate ligase
MTVWLLLEMIIRYQLDESLHQEAWRVDNPKPDSASRPKVHFSGIGGTAMVAGARLAIDAGWEVRGSDNPLYPPTSDMVEALGVPVAKGYAPENLDWRPDCVVIGNALSRGNPEVEATLDRRLHYLSLPEWLKENVLRARRPVAICGTHGKTTTTALTAHVLERCGLDPGYLIGGQPLGLARSARLGPENAPFVIEGDEYDTSFFDKRAKFFHYLPEIAVVTSVEFDHGDIYRDLAEIEVAFQRMLRQIPRHGQLIVCADNHAASLTSHAFCPVVTYGFSESAEWRAEILGADGPFQRLKIFHGGAYWRDLEVPLAGRHNAQNALAAVAVAAALDAPPERIADGMRSFPGVRRRMEVFLESNGMTFVDDFAHHPTAIRETIAAARGRWPGRRLRVLFEPRSNTTVTNAFQPDLTEAFSGADEVWLGPIYRGDRIPEAERLDRAALAATLAARGVVCRFTDDTAELADGVLKGMREKDVVLILSNGAFGGIYTRFREHFQTQT